MTGGIEKRDTPTIFPVARWDRTGLWMYLLNFKIIYYVFCIMLNYQTILCYCAF